MQKIYENKWVHILLLFAVLFFLSSSYLYARVQIIIIYLCQTQQRSIITRKNKNIQTNLSGTTQSINMHANLAKM